MKSSHLGAFAIAALVLSGCAWDGGPVIQSDGDHQINLGGPLTDSKPLAAQVRQKLRNNGQTALARIQVSSPESDTVRLAGYVSNDGIRQEAERLAYEVDGVRFVLNTLDIR